jgi:outer membrane lipoprotein-sorting protein
MPRLAPILVLASILGACARGERSDPDAQTLAEAKSGLAERERRLTSFRLEGTVREAGQDASFETAFRAPNRVRGALRPGGRTLSFDGIRLYELDPAQKTVLTLAPGEGSSAALTQLMAAFVPEGYRAPVMPLGSARARRLRHPRGPEAVELSTETQDEQGRTVEVAYVLRWPSADLIEKRLSAYGTTKTVAVDEEQCDSRLNVCVPRKLTERIDGTVGAVTTLTRIELNGAIPADEFIISPPEGYAARTQGSPRSR